MRNLKFLVLSGVISLTLAAPALALASHNAPENGIQGKVTKVICEWNRRHTKVSCDNEYVPATIIVRTLGGSEVIRFNSSEKGKFEVALAPGSYRLVSAEPGTTLYPSSVVVEEDDYTKLKLHINGDINLNL